MAPGCSAGRLPLCSVFTVCFVIYLSCQEVSALIVSDRQTPLEIGGYFDRFTYDKLISSPPCLEEIPAFLRRPPLHLVPPETTQEKTWEMGGLRVRLKSHLRSLRLSDHCRDLHLLDVRMRTRGRWIQPVFLDIGGFDSVSCSLAPDQLLLHPSSWRVPTGRRAANPKKEELLQLITGQLVERGLLPLEDAGKANVAPPQTVPPVTAALSDPPVLLGMSAEELRLTLRVKEMEVQAMHLRCLARCGLACAISCRLRGSTSSSGMIWQEVFPSSPEVMDDPAADVCVCPAEPDMPPVFPSCVVTRAQAHKFEEVTDLSDSFLRVPDSTVPSPENESVPVSVDVQLEGNLCLS
ncbi:hypothetical protein L3Q82_004088, partial [Xyrichtys novacula]